MRVVHTDAHRLHDPKVEFETSSAHSPFENPRRVEQIRAALQADPAFRLESPTEWGTAPIEAVHATGLVQFLQTAWEEFQRVNPPTAFDPGDLCISGSTC